MSEEALENLRLLSERWGVHKVQVLELLLKEAIRENRELRALKGEK